jgi:hypothetical protein
MNKPTILKTERVDDIPLLLAQLERMSCWMLFQRCYANGIFRLMGIEPSVVQSPHQLP